MGVRLSWREIRAEDLSAALDLLPANVGGDDVGRGSALHVWDQLLRHPAFRGIVIERDPSMAGQRIVAAGAGVFVRPDFMTAEIANPRPGLNARIIASVARGRPVLLSLPEIARGNAGAGLDVVNLIGSWLQTGLSAEELAMINGLLAASFLEAHRGYRLHRIIRELPCEAELDVVRPLFRVIHMAVASRRWIALLTKDEAFRSPHSMACLMFQYREPELRLSQAHQQLLLAALKMQTDDELANALGLTLPAVKQRWRSVFERIEQVKPELVVGLAADKRAGRGRQKRHHVLSYLQVHPEELRPYAWPQGTRRRPPAAS